MKNAPQCHCLQWTMKQSDRRNGNTSAACRPLLPYLFVLSLQTVLLFADAFRGLSWVSTSPFNRQIISPRHQEAGNLCFRLQPPVSFVAKLRTDVIESSKFRSTRWSTRHSILQTKMSDSKKSLSVEISTLVDPAYARTLAIICCRSFYGEHRPMDAVNVFASLQRALLFEEIVGDLSRRLVRYQSMSSNSALGCGRVLTAVDNSGTLVGFLDLSLTLYDKVSNEFLVSEGPGLTLPRAGTERRAYIANLAVSKEARRQSVAEKLLQEAEEMAKKWSDCDSLWLEVSESNLAAVSLYKKLGYQVKLLDSESTEVVRGPLGYSMQRSPRLRFGKLLEREEDKEGP